MKVHRAENLRKISADLEKFPKISGKSVKFRKFRKIPKISGKAAKFRKISNIFPATFEKFRKNPGNFRKFCEKFGEFCECCENFP